jgi:hypothetical protein
MARLVLRRKRHNMVYKPAAEQRQKKDNQYSVCYATVEISLGYSNGNSVSYMVHAEMLQVGQSEATTCQQFS